MIPVKRGYYLTNDDTFFCPIGVHIRRVSLYVYITQYSVSRSSNIRNLCVHLHTIYCMYKRLK